MAKLKIAKRVSTAQFLVQEWYRGLVLNILLGREKEIAALYKI